MYIVLMSLGPGQNHMYGILGPDIGNYKFYLAGCGEKEATFLILDLVKSQPIVFL